MSFIGVLKHIGHIVGIVSEDAAPFGSLISLIPVFGPVASTVLAAIVAEEKNVQSAGAGAAKKAAVTAKVNVLAPGIDPATLSTAIDEMVAALNALFQSTSLLGDDKITH